LVANEVNARSGNMPQLESEYVRNASK